MKSRQDWDAREPVSTTAINKPVSKAFFHWPGTVRPTDDDAEWLRGIQNYHMDEKGWWDIGYSHAAGRDGTLYECRGWAIRGGHTVRHNTTSYGLVFLVGTDEEEPTAAQYDAGARWLKIGQEEGWFDGVVVRAHREVANTDCPGDAISSFATILNETGWDEVSVETPDEPELDSRLVEAYRDILKIEPTGFARVWQRRMDEGVVTIDDVRWKLWASRNR